MTEMPIADAEVRPGQMLEQLRARGRSPKRNPERAAFFRMLGLVRPHRATMAWGVLLGLGVALTYAASLGGLLPVLKVVVERENLHTWLLERAERAPAWYAPVLQTIARWFPNDDSAAARMNSLMVLLGGLLLLNLVGNGLRAVSQYLVLYASNRTVMDLRRKMYRKALHVPMTDISRDLSNAVSRFMSDVREVFLGIVTLFGKVVREPLKAVCVLGVALVIDWRLTLLALVITPPAVGLLWYFGRKVRKATTRLLVGYGMMLGNLEESLQGIDTVKGYARQGHERRRMWQLERRMFTHQKKLAWIEAISSPLIELVGVLAAGVVIVWLAGRVFSHELEASQFMTMVVLLAALLDPIRKVANVYNMVQRSGAAAERIFAFLDQPEERSRRQPVELVGDGARAVRFERVCFRYSPESPPALDGISLEIRPGECVAIVGPNGSGKSTLMRLLPRLLERQEGRILVDGVEVRELSLRRLREQIAIVAQRPAIFARTVRENIAYGNEHATLDEVRRAACLAHADDFIEQLAQGYETVLGEFGTSLSGGQRQRLAIARAFLKPATLLIFDEATSEIDADSEHKIHAALAELRRGKTTFLIAHRHTVMDLAERIVVMDAGRIVDLGTHAELIERCPLYVALYRAPK